MCCCEKPTTNGQPGYRWQPTDKPSIREPNPPDLQDGDTLLYDEPGRCGGVDCHCHHYRVVRHYSSLYLLVRHGGGDQRIAIQCYGNGFKEAIAAMDSNIRYWLLAEIYAAHSHGERAGREAETYRWREAAAEKRIKTRKLPGQGIIKVWIEPKVS